MKERKIKVLFASKDERNSTKIKVSSAPKDERSSTKK